MTKNSIGAIVVLVALVGIVFARLELYPAQHAPDPVAVIDKSPTPPAREPVKKSSVRVSPTFSEPGHRVFYLLDSKKRVHYCYEDTDLPLDAADVGKVLEGYGEDPNGKLATAFICL